MIIIELPINLTTDEVMKKLEGYTYLHSYPLEYKSVNDGYVKTIRYFVEEKQDQKKGKK